MNRETKSQPSSLNPRAGLVSVVIGSYNYAHFIAQALDSVLAQTYPHWECIVVDDGSTDSTREVVAAYAEADQRIHYFSQENQGLAVARNTGIAKSSGEYFQFLDADDLIEPRKLECQVQILKQGPEIDIVYGEVRYLATEKSEQRLFTAAELNIASVVKVSGQGKEVLLALARGNITPTTSILLRRRVLSSVGPFEAAANEAYDYWVRSALHGTRFHFEDHDRARGIVRLHSSNMSKNRRKLIKSELLVHRRIVNSVSDREVLLFNKRRMAHLEGEMGIEEAAERHPVKAIYKFAKAARMDPRLRRCAKWFAYACSAPFVAPERLRKMFSALRLTRT